MDKPSPYFSNLKCRECGKLYPKQAIHVCDFDFGPLEAAYNYEAIGAVLRGPRSSPALSPCGATGSCSRSMVSRRLAVR